ncbi:hypothetical protein [Leucobacter sp. cx-169]|uniref:hypothetical protein n=1 Tax=Leucobacter sp. cx-169 TaxID=2770549 RepID=UPI00165E033C|nr:hypothetical protein [Leucobacter sp. cx-169]MBC9927379.1 hypothetical protein [Leucobacter sp. cx-169]
MPKKRQPRAAVSHANPQLAAAMRELRRSNAAQPHVPKPLKGTRAARARRAIDDTSAGTHSPE